MLGVRPDGTVLHVCHAAGIEHGSHVQRLWALRADAERMSLWHHAGARRVFGIGWMIARAVYEAILWVLGQRRAPAP